MTKKKIVLIGVGIVLVGTIVWTIRVIRNSPRISDSRGDITDIAPTKTATSGEKAKVIVSPGIDIDYGYATNTPETLHKKTKLASDAPSLNRPVVIPGSFSSSDSVLIKESINKVIDTIRKNPENGALWADLGVKRKGIEDYVGAKEAYEYAFKLMPKSAMVADSLGVIYGDYLKDYPRAEQHFRLAIALDPYVEYRYIRLFELYQYAFKDTAKAKAILKEGLTAFPGNASFSVLLESLN